MVDSFEIVRTLEKVYYETYSVGSDKKQLSILVLIISIILYYGSLIFLVFPIIAMHFIVQLILLGLLIAIVFLLPYINKKFLEQKYGISYKNDEASSYEIYKKNILQQSIIKETLILAKSILELETREDTHYMTKRLIEYSSCASILIIAIDKIFKDYLEILLFIFILAMILFIPILRDTFHSLFNRKQNTKKAILKMVERLIIEL
jgi:hypothetical protein